MRNRQMFLTLLSLFLSGALNAQDAITVYPSGKVGVGTSQEPTIPGVQFQVEGRIADSSGLVMPVGAVLPYFGEASPEGWFLCDGMTPYSQAAFPELFSLIGTTYSLPGDPPGTFRVPDLRGMFL